MGTSQSSRGPGSGLPLVPPWVPAPPPAGADSDLGSPPAPDSSKPASQPATQTGFASPVAVPRRFGSARTAFGSFARSGDKSALRRGGSEYVRKGYGGKSETTNPVERTAPTARS